LFVIPSASRSGPSAALITYAVSGNLPGIPGIWLLKLDGVLLVTFVISDVTGSVTAVVGLRPW
jgi:hypothetical protein